jgi:hypothetical protein
MDKQLYFFWDYPITEDEVRAILRGDDADEKAWVISRILQYAKWEDIWKYLTIKAIVANFANVHFRYAAEREWWAYALKVWGYVS